MSDVVGVALERARRALASGGLAAGAVRYAGAYRDALAARRALRDQWGGGSLDEAFTFAWEFGHRGIHIRPAQLRSEIVALLELVERERPRRSVEIGTSLGGSLFLLCQAAPTDAAIVSVDVPLHPLDKYGSGYHESRRILYRAFGRGRQRLRLVLGDSHDSATVARAERALRGPVDLLFVDGDHSYEGVTRDWELWLPLVRPGGLVAFHDVQPGAYSGGVPRFWAELLEGRDVEEIVADPGQESFGIGLVRL